MARKTSSIVNPGIIWVGFIGLAMMIAPWTPLREISSLEGLRKNPILNCLMGVFLLSNAIFFHTLERRVKYPPPRRRLFGSRRMRPVSKTIYKEMIITVKTHFKEMDPNVDYNQVEQRISENLSDENILRSSIIEEDLRKTRFPFLLYARKPYLFLGFINDLIIWR